MYLAGLESLPQDIYEAAKVDGATAMQRFWKITLPLLTPAIAGSMQFAAAQSAAPTSPRGARPRNPSPPSGRPVAVVMASRIETDSAASPSTISPTISASGSFASRCLAVPCPSLL